MKNQLPVFSIFLKYKEQDGLKMLENKVRMEGALLTEELDIILNPCEMNEPGIAGAALLKKNKFSIIGDNNTQVRIFIIFK